MLDLDRIRGDIEGTFAAVFNPPAFDAAASYVAGDRVNVSGMVWRAVTPTPGDAPVSPLWEVEGEAVALLYENVEGSIPANGAIRLVTSWASTEAFTIPSGRSGRWNRCSGTLTCWALTPINRGTSAGLRIAARIRKAFLLWSNGAIGTCGAQVTMTNPDGPRSILPAAGATFHGHVLTCSLTAIETITPALLV
jgi:hypothetical protein